MDPRMLFERNMLALAGTAEDLCKRLSSAVTTRDRYRLLNARNGLSVPAVVDRGGSAKPLHSLVDPEKEARRLVSTINGPSFLVVLGLGGGYVVQAALERPDIHGVLVIDFDLDGIAELLAAKEYVPLFGDARFRLLVDPTEEVLVQELYSLYRPALTGGIAVIPNRPRIDADPEPFAAATETVKGVIDSISDDYSVQAYFGKRWFANSVRNILAAQAPIPPMPPARRVAVTAAGPSLDEQLPLLKAKRSGLFVLATDTSLPALLAADLKPDAVISIDCQHISYYHFMAGLPGDVPLYLDLASPPVVASRSRAPRFFSGGHPFTVYVSRAWRAFPRVDTSGGNVTYAAVDLANRLGAERIELYGADFSYPGGSAYARGTYIHPYFRRYQTRLKSLESQFAAFVFRNDSLKLERSGQGWRYETKPLVGYRTRLEKLSREIEATLVPMPGGGAPIQVFEPKKRTGAIRLLGAGAAAFDARTFLERYRASVLGLPDYEGSLAGYLAGLKDEERDVLTTLLPAAAAIRRRNSAASPAEVIRSVKEYCDGELLRLLTASRT